MVSRPVFWILVSSGINTPRPFPQTFLSSSLSAVLFPKINFYSITWSRIRGLENYMSVGRPRSSKKENNTERKHGHCSMRPEKFCIVQVMSCPADFAKIQQPFRMSPKEQIFQAHDPNITPLYWIMVSSSAYTLALFFRKAIPR